MLANQKFSLS